MGEEPKLSICSDPDLQLEGFNNANLKMAAGRIEKQGLYKNQSTVIVCPTMRMLPVPVVASWLQLLRPMNQKIAGPLLYDGYEVSAAYNGGVEAIIGQRGLDSFPYLLTIEHDNIIPRDGLIRLLESIDGSVDGNKYDAVGGLYWTKKLPEGYPIILGNPEETPRNFFVQVPKEDTVQPCNGMGMGFTLWRLSMFREGKIEKPYFAAREELSGVEEMVRQTQDIHFFDKALDAGYKFAVDTRVKVGHLDMESGVIW
jgi:hypothetical protein